MSEKINETTGIRVFVYGTLKKDHPNHHLLDREGVYFIGRCYIEGPFHMLDLSYFPGVVKSTDASSSNRIYGEVYRVDDETLDSLDILEGNGSFYTRKQEETPWKKAWVYLLPQNFEETYDIVSSGAWAPTKDEQNYIKEQEKKSNVSKSS